jgi:hypothetical protein
MPAQLAQQEDENDSPPTEGNSDTLGWQTGVGSKPGKLSPLGTHPRPPAVDIPSVGEDFLGREAVEMMQRKSVMEQPA